MKSKNNFVNLFKKMKKLLHGALLPFSIFVSGLLLLGCEQANRLTQGSTDERNQGEKNLQSEPTSTELSSGNVLYIARDVAEMQLKTGEYITQLKQTQADLQQAIDSKDPQQLEQVANTLDGQLNQLHTALTALDLKSQEIDAIRQNLQQNTQQALASPFLKGEVDFSKVDFKQIEQQMGSIQTDMVKLAAMLIPKGDKAEPDQTKETES